MFLIPSGRECSGKRRAAVLLSAIVAAIGGLVGSLLEHGWNVDEPGVDPTWHFVSLGVCALVVVVGAGLLLVRWRRGQESD